MHHAAVMPQLRAGRCRPQGGAWISGRTPVGPLPIRLGLTGSRARGNERAGGQGQRGQGGGQRAGGAPGQGRGAGMAMMLFGKEIKRKFRLKDMVYKGELAL